LRAVVQRVARARITVEERLIAVIGKGLLVYLGIETGDQERDAEYLLEKIINLRIFEDDSGKMNLSLLGTGGDLLIVSQFTLLGDCRKGRRPSFTSAAAPPEARGLYGHFIDQARAKTSRVASGEFQAMMRVDSINDGPVTILLDSRKLF